MPTLAGKCKFCLKWTKTCRQRVFSHISAQACGWTVKELHGDELIHVLMLFFPLVSRFLCSICSCNRVCLAPNGGLPTPTPNAVVYEIATGCNHGRLESWFNIFQKRWVNTLHPLHQSVGVPYLYWSWAISAHAAGAAVLGFDIPIFSLFFLQGFQVWFRELPLQSFLRTCRCAKCQYHVSGTIYILRNYWGWKNLLHYMHPIFCFLLNLVYENHWGFSKQYWMSVSQEPNLNICGLHYWPYWPGKCTIYLHVVEHGGNCYYVSWTQWLAIHIDCWTLFFFAHLHGHKCIILQNMFAISPFILQG